MVPSVAMVGEEVAGFISVQPRPLPPPLPSATEGYIDIIEVPEKHRRMGIARRLSEAATSRVGRISKKLPYTLDLVALMMAAGSTFSEAIETLIRDEPDDDFNEELALVMAEIEFGTRRSEALAHMAERIPLAEAARAHELLERGGHAGKLVLGTGA